MFTGINIKLRALEPSDVDVMYEWENNVDLWRFGSTKTLVSKSALNTMVEHANLSIFEVDQQRFMIETLHGDRVGVIDLFHFDFFHSRIELGMLISPEYQNQGAGKEAVALIEEYVFDFLTIHQIVVEITEDNVACIALFEKMGYHKGGYLKDWIKRGNSYLNLLIYQKIKV